MAVSWSLLKRNSYPLLFAALVLIASANRETGAFLVAAYALTAYRCGKLRWSWLALYAVIWLTITVGLRLALGTPDSRFTLAGVWALNMARMPGGALYLVLCVGGLALVGAIGWRRAPGFVRALWPVIIVYAGACLAFGVWGEVRIWTPVLPLLVVPVIGLIMRLNNQHEGAKQ